MVKIPGGSARVGSNSGDSDEKPVHRVTLPSFELSKYEVTRGQFAIFVEETGYQTDAEKNSGDKKGCFSYRGGTNFGWVRGMSWRYAGFDQGNDHPVICVSHNDAQVYIDWLSNKTGKRFRLLRSHSGSMQYVVAAMTDTVLVTMRRSSASTPMERMPP